MGVTSEWQLHANGHQVVVQLCTEFRTGAGGCLTKPKKIPLCPGTLGLFIRSTLAGTISVWRALRKANVQMCEIPATARGGQKTASNSVRFSQHQQENGSRPR